METHLTARIEVDAGRWQGELAHNWNYIGYDECNYTYTPEGQQLLAKFGALQEKPYYVRTHHLLCTGNCLGVPKWGSTNVYREDEAGNPRYDWTHVDLIFDTILHHGCRPFVELGFMPMDLADPAHAPGGPGAWSFDGYRARGWACPPKDYRRWHDLVHHLVEHCVERHGVEAVGTWYWELWNEPDLDYYWQGTVEEYLKLYDFTAAAVKAACPRARVGGPGTTNPVRERRSGQYLDRFLEHCARGTNYVTGTPGSPLDFVSFHAKGGSFDFDLSGTKHKPPSVQRLLQLVQTGYEIVSRYPGYCDLECVLSEVDPDGWAAGGAWDNPNLNYRNTEYYASYVAAAFDRLSRFAAERQWDLRFLSWAFMFVGERCFEGTRTFSTQGIDKAILNLFRLYARLGGRRVHLTSSAARDLPPSPEASGQGEAPDVSGIATLTGTRSLEVLVYNHHDDWDVAGACEVELEIRNLPFGGEVTMQHYRIDGRHSNAYAEWVRQGRPMYPAPGQRLAIKAREGLELLDAPRRFALRDGGLNLSFTLPVHGISLIVVTAPEA